MGRIRIQIELDDPDVNVAGSLVHLVVRDTSVADALHPAVVQTTGTLEDGLTGGLTVDVPDGVLSPQRSYSLFAHVDRTGDEQIRAGDMITTHNISVSAADTADDAPTVIARCTKI